MANAQPESEIAVGLNLCSAATGRINEKWHRLAVRLEPLASKALQVIPIGNPRLIREDISPESLRHLGRYFVLEISGVDRCSPGPIMAQNQGVVMNQRNPILLHRRAHNGRGIRTIRTFQVVKLHDCNLCASRRLENRRISKRGRVRGGHRDLGGQRNR